MAMDLQKRIIEARKNGQTEELSLLEMLNKERLALPNVIFKLIESNEEILNLISDGDYAPVKATQLKKENDYLASLLLR